MVLSLGWAEASPFNEFPVAPIPALSCLPGLPIHVTFSSFSVTCAFVTSGRETLSLQFCYRSVGGLIVDLLRLWLRTGVEPLAQ